MPFGKDSIEVFFPQPADDVRRDPVDSPEPPLAGTHEEEVLSIRRNPGASVHAAGVDLITEGNLVRP